MVRTRFSRIPVLLALVTLTIGAQPPEPAGGPPGAYIVQITEGADPGQIGRVIAQRTGGKLGHVYTAALRGFSMQLPPGPARQAIAEQPGVLIVEPDVRVYAFGQTLPTGVDRIDADRNTVAKIDGIDEPVDVDIAIIDTGIDIDHPDLNVVGGRHFCSLWGLLSFEDGLYDDDNGHGTHCAGIAAARDNGIGVVGVAPGARLWAVKALDSSGSGYLSDIIAGVDWVTAHAATIEVASMSLGATASSSIFRTASSQTGPVFDVAVVEVDAPASVIQGAAVSVDVTVRNVGNEGVGAFNVVLTDGSAEIGSQSVTNGLGPGASATLTYSWDTTECDLGEHTLTASHNAGGDQYSANDSSSAVTTLVASLTDIAITSVTGPSTVTQGGSAQITVTVKNVGNQAVSDIAVTLKDTTAGQDIGAPQTVDNLAAGESANLTFSWNTTGVSSGDHTLTASHPIADDNLGNNENSMTVKVAAQTGPPVAHVSVLVSSWPTLRKGWKGMALVTVTGDGGQEVLYATVEGRWSGIYTATVKGSTDNSSIEVFITKLLSRSGTMTFTVTRIVGQDGRVYDLDPPQPSDSYTGP